MLVLIRELGVVFGAMGFVLLAGLVGKWGAEWARVLLGIRDDGV